jgi:Leucine-rich repeat (LRR) protein
VIARPTSRTYRLRRLIQRNRMAFATGAVACVALIAGTAVTAWQAIRAEREAARANAALADLRATVPAFVAQARGLVTQGRFNDAIEKLDYALRLQPDSREILLAKADLLESQLRLDEAAQTYREVLRIAPDDERAKRHVTLCEQLEKGELSRERLANLYQAMIEEQRSAAELLPIARQLGEAKAVLVSFWLAQLKSLPIPSDPPLDQRLTMRTDGLLRLDLSDSSISDLGKVSGMPLGALILARCSKISDLSPLRGMALKELDLSNTSVADVSALQGMTSLEHLILNDTRVIDLSPLRGLRLERLSLWNQNVSDLTPLGGMNLRGVTISAIAANDFTVLKDMPLEYLTLHKTRVTDLAFLKGMPLKGIILGGSSNARGFSTFSEIPTLKSLVLPWPMESIPNEELLAIAALRSHTGLEQITAELTLMGMNPRTTFTAKEDFFREWDDAMAWRVALTEQGGKVDVQPYGDEGMRIKISGSNVTDLSALSGLLTLKGKPIRELILRRTGVSDLTPISKMPLKVLDIEYTKVEDLEPIRGMPLEWISVTDTKVADIGALTGMKTLTNVGLGGTKVTDLTPLTGLTLSVVVINKLKIPSLSPLAGMPLKQLLAFETTIGDMSVISQLPLEHLHLGAAKLTDIAFLAGCKTIKFLWLSDTNISDIQALTDLKIEELHLGNTRVRDLTPLSNLPLKTLTIDRCPVKDLSVLRDIPTLEGLVISRDAPNLSSLRTHPRLKYISTRWDMPNNRPAETAEAFWAALEKRKK